MALFWVQLQSGCKVNIVHNKYLNVTIERYIYIYIYQSQVNISIQTYPNSSVAATWWHLNSPIGH